MTICESFPPAGSDDPHILILGTMPGVVSLQKREYYGHPQNSFWRIMGDLFGAFPSVAYEKRLEILAQRNIALFDTIKKCVRPGSADSDISEKVPHDFNSFFEAHPHVGHVFFDGGMAFDTFRRMVLPTLRHPAPALTCLPSTSPRNATMNYKQKLAAWMIVKDLST